MASKRDESTGCANGEAKDSKVGKLKHEGRQSKLVTEDNAGRKRVSFRIEGNKEGKERLCEIKVDLKTELRKRFKDLEDRLEKEIGELREEVKACKEYIEGHKNTEKSWERKWEKMKKNWKELEKEWGEKVEKRLEERFREYKERKEREEREDSEIRSERRMFASREGNGELRHGLE